MLSELFHGTSGSLSAVEVTISQDGQEFTARNLSASYRREDEEHVALQVSFVANAVPDELQEIRPGPVTVEIVDDDWPDGERRLALGEAQYEPSMLLYGNVSQCTFVLRFAIL